MDEDTYRVPGQEAQAEIRLMSSRFLAFAFPVASEQEARRHLEVLRRQFHDADHIPFAYRLWHRHLSRASDDGEPPRTAGTPILRAVEASGLENVLVAVVRYFGGTRLGTGRLAHAYGTAAHRSITEAGAKTCYERALLEIDCPYDRVSLIKRLLAPPEVECLREEFGKTARFRLAVRLGRLAAIKDRLSQAAIPYTVL